MFYDSKYTTVFQKNQEIFPKTSNFLFCAKARQVFLDNYGKIRIKSLDKRPVWEYHYYVLVFTILSLTETSHRNGKGGTRLNSELFLSQLHTERLGHTLAFFASLDSTSSYIRRNLPFLPHGFTAIAEEQLGGRGRQGKSFYSPKNDGLYFSFLLKDEKYRNDPLFTIRISYAACRAADKLTGTESIKIKWVNDLYIGQKKLCGILCEAPGGAPEALIVGIGVNFTVDKSLVPQELRQKIGSLRDVSAGRFSKETLGAYILNELEEMYLKPLNDEEFLAAYRRRSAVLGKEIQVLHENDELRAAALDIAPDGGLIVRYPSGITDKLTAGEISILING